MSFGFKTLASQEHMVLVSDITFTNVRQKYHGRALKFTQNFFQNFNLRYPKSRPVPVSKCSDKFPGEVIFVGLINPQGIPAAPPRNINRGISIMYFKPANFAE